MAATEVMIERTKRRFDLKPKRLAADTAYGTGKFLAFVVGAGIIPHIPVWDLSKRERAGVASTSTMIACSTSIR